MIQTLEQARALRWQREILAMARMLSPDEAAVRDWYAGDGIVVLDHLTAAQLVQRGQGERVVAFLLGIARAEQAQATMRTTPAEGTAALQPNDRGPGLAAYQAIGTGSTACSVNRSTSSSNASLTAAP
jgi:hypothetical protein